MLRVAIVAPSMRILGGQAVQAARLLRAWEHDREVSAWLVPINPMPRPGLRWMLGIKYLRTVVTQMHYWPLLVRELRRADVVHVFSASYVSFLLAPLPAVIVAKALGRPVVLNYRSGEAPDHLRRSAIARATLRQVDRILVPSRFLREVFASFGLQADVVPNIVDVERFRFRLRDPVAPRLVSTRNFERLYNVGCTLRAFRLVQDEYPDASLTLVGGGSQEGALRELAHSLSLRNVFFAGRVAPDEIWRFYADADIYVQTPDIDNMPSSLLEAFASGTPAVSTDAGGVPALLVGEVHGLLAPAGDHAAVARQIVRVLREPGLATRLATTARAACDRYIWPPVRRQWISVYRSQAGTFGRRGRIARVRGLDRKEIRFRVTTAARRAVRRLASLGRTPTWRRAHLLSRLAAGDPSLQPAADRLKARDWVGAHQELMRHFQRRPSRIPMGPAARRAVVRAVAAHFPSAADDARRRADAILAGRYDLLGYTALEFGHSPNAEPASSTPEGPDPLSLDRSRGLALEARAGFGADVDWKRDPVSGRRAADGWWSDIRYLEASNGDHKIIWELNRHQHWLTLGRAFWLLEHEPYRSRFVDELTGWMQQNPPLTGINWASMLELALRSVSWVWALHFFIDDPCRLATTDRDTPWLVDLLLGIDRQMQHVEENLSHYFSPNTHLTGEALGLYVVGRVLPELRASSRRAALGRQILIEQSARQVAPDGGHVERSTHYHRYTLDFYLMALAVARRTGDTAAVAAFEPVVSRLARFAWAVADANGCLPRIGDDDAGALWRLTGHDAADVRPSLSVAASLLPGDVPVEEPAEESIWLVGAGVEGPDPLSDGHSRGLALGDGGAGAEDWDRSCAFPATGYYVSRSRSGDHLVFDAGPHGFLNGGHAHADALSVTLAVRWQPLLIDTGTGTYTADPVWRDRFRSTALHNTLVLDGRSQAHPDGPFHWATVADSRAIRWASNARFDFAEASHHAYAPATHRRAVFSGGGEMWVVADHVLDQGPHAAAVHWHLDPDWRVRVEAHAVEAQRANGLHAALASTSRQLEIFRGDADSGLGWCSPAYGRIVPCCTLRFSQSGESPFSIVSVIVPAHDARHLAVEPLPATHGPAGAYASAVRVCRPDALDLALFVVPAEDEAVTSGKWRFAGFETDARFCRIQVDPAGTVRSVSLVDGSFVERVSGGPPFRVAVAHCVGDLAVDLQPDGLVDISGPVSLATLAIDAPAVAMTRVRLNESPASFRRLGSAVVVPAGQAAVGVRRSAGAPLRIATR